MTGPALRPGQRVLLRMPDWVGDFVMAEPATRALVARLGPEGLALAGPGRLLELLGGLPAGVRRIPHEAGTRGTARSWRGHDVALLLTGSFRSAWLALRAGIPTRVGWARDGRGVLLTDGYRPPLERGAVPLGLGRAGRRPRVLPRPFGGAVQDLLGFVGVPVPDPIPRLAVEPAAEERVEGRLRAEGWEAEEPLVVASVGARPGSAKGFGAERWARALTELARHVDARVVLVGGPGEEAPVREVSEALQTSALALVDPVLDLLELVALLRRADLLLVTDSGPRHLAQAVGTPTVCLAGPTDPRHTADHLERTRLLRRTVPCGPCHLERCPEAGEARGACFEALPADEIARAAASLLQ